MRGEKRKDKVVPAVFLEQFNQAYLALQKQTSKKWKRDLPSLELFSDRWERAQRLKFGKNSSIYQNSYVYGDVKVGESTWIGPFTILDGTGGLTIGDFCSISSGVQIYSHDSVDWCLSGGKNKYKYAKVKIKDCCYIGPGTTISKGTTIGSHCLIGALSFVNTSFPPYSIICGAPAKIIGKVVIDEKNNKVTLVYINKPR